MRVGNKAIYNGISSNATAELLHPSYGGDLFADTWDDHWVLSMRHQRLYSEVIPVILLR